MENKKTKEKKKKNIPPPPTPKRKKCASCACTYWKENRSRRSAIPRGSIRPSFINGRRPSSKREALLLKAGAPPLEFLGKVSVKSKRWKASCAARMSSSPRSWRTWCGQKRNLGRVKGPVGTARCA